MPETDTTDSPLTWSRVFPAVPKQVREASRFLAAILDGQPSAGQTRPEGDGQHGHGLSIVRQLAADWGVTLIPDGRTVWFEAEYRPGNDGPATLAAESDQPSVHVVIKLHKIGACAYPPEPTMPCGPRSSSPPPGAAM